ncbi:hypothetical protein HDV06_005588 [Boothiomyces sp. JEL0866]|nr:hypothetical protein HDV06_005588 [Boothiomyces sp. JEL0866]
MSGASIKMQTIQQPPSDSVASRIKTPKKQITKEQLETLIPTFKRNANAKVDFEKLLKLLNQKSFKLFADRQQGALEKLVSIYKSGIPIAGLVSITELLDPLLNLIQRGSTNLVSPFCDLLKLFQYELSNIRIFPNLQDEDVDLHSYPCKQQDQITENITNLINTLCRVIQCKHEDLVLVALDALFQISGGDVEQQNHNKPIKIQFSKSVLQTTAMAPHNFENMHTKNSKFLLHAATKSSIIPNLTQLLISSNDISAIFVILKCLESLTKSNTFCKQIISNENQNQIVVLKKMLLIIQDYREKDAVLFLNFELWWNILESDVKIEAAKYLGQHEQLQLIYLELGEFIKTAKRKIEKQKRNELLFLLSKIVEYSPESNFVQVPILGLILANLQIEMNQEEKDEVIDEEDFEFKRMVVNIAKLLCNNNEARNELLNAGLLQQTLRFLNCAPNSQLARIYDQDHLSVLQISILGLISNLIPTVHKEFRMLDGPEILMGYLDKLIEEGTDIQSKRVDLVRVHVNLLDTCLLTILAFAEGGPTNKKILSSFNIFHKFLALLSRKTPSTEIWIKCLLSCSSLCQGYKANKQNFGEAGGVELMIEFLKYFSTHFRYDTCDPKEKERVLLSTVECIWGTICGNFIFENKFLQLDGMFYLLELLETSTYDNKRHALGCILDFLENPKAVLHVLQWRTKEKSTKGIEHLLIGLWSLEEEKLEVLQGPQGSISPDSQFPLRGLKSKKIELLKNGIEPDGGRAVLEIQENLRLGFQNFPNTLSVTEKTKLAMISKYLDFKIGEVWNEIGEELKYENIRPISPDLCCIRAIEETVKAKTLAVIEKQSEIIRKAEKESQEKEEEFFNHWKYKFLPEVPPPRKPRIHTWRQRQFNNANLPK